MTAAPFPVGQRDYSLVGPDSRRAVEIGLASAEWYHSDVPRAVMKDLMKRTDGPAIRDTILWFALLIGGAWGGIYFWGTWACVPFLLVYSVIYGSSCDSRWHECGHGTAFRTPWMNDVIYQIASFMVMRNPVTWRWSHARHHTDTYIVGRDAEIAWMRPPKTLTNFLALFDVIGATRSLLILARNATGRLTPDEKDFVPESEWGKLILAARIHMAIYAATIAVALATWSWLPLMLVGLPRIYGSWHMVMCGHLQHAGLAENVLDHRLNTRTVYMNPISRYIYWNMNYHIEHHMFPMVPYHALPRLHEVIKADLPPPNLSILDGYREVFASLRRQKTDPEYYLRKTLPPSAKPYREEFHTLNIARSST
ncbi:MAG: fatty acid desaturase family protein [Rhodobacter sp.]|nr:fatty acid desaturase family protein [Rhodobacter sp.]